MYKSLCDFATSLSIVVLLGLECTHVMPKSYRGLLKKSSRRVPLGVLKQETRRKRKITA